MPVSWSLASKQWVAPVSRTSSRLPATGSAPAARAATTVFYAGSTRVRSRCWMRTKNRAPTAAGRKRAGCSRAHNALGEYQRAREICVEALSCLTSADLEFVVWNLGVEIELAMAESGLGNHAEAARQLDELISKHARCAGRSRWVRCTMPEHALR